MASVLVVFHARPTGEGYDDVKMIGVYSSKELAEQAVARLRRMPGFSEAPDGFSVDSYELDKDHWAEGFFTTS